MVVVYETFNVSPDATVLSPPVKSFAEYNVPEEPPLVLLFTTKPPAIVAEPLMLKDDAADVLIAADEAAANVMAGLVAFE